MARMRAHTHTHTKLFFNLPVHINKYFESVYDRMITRRVSLGLLLEHFVLCNILLFQANGRVFAMSSQ